MARTITIRRAISDIEWVMHPYARQQELILRRTVAEAERAADDEEQRPAWERFAHALQGSE